MNSNCLKSVVLAVYLFLIMSCLQNPHDQSADLSTEDSLKIALKDSLRKMELAIEDSLRQAKRDSIEAALAYANRPWKISYLSDEFGYSTNEKCIVTQSDGLFSNSATSNSYLFAQIIITKIRTGILLHEYNRSKPPAKFIDSRWQKGTLLMRNSDGRTLKLPVVDSNWGHSGGLRFGGTLHPEIVKFFKASDGSIEIYIKDNFSSEYRFSINVLGFTDEYSLL